MLIQFSSTGQQDRQHSCESFELLLKNVHQVLLSRETNLSIELGDVEGQVVQTIRTEDSHTARIVKQALRNTFDAMAVHNLPEKAFMPENDAKRYIAPVQLYNDFYSIRRWRELLTEADPLSGLLSALSVNRHARFQGHISLTLTPLSEPELKNHFDCFSNLQKPFFARHKNLAKLYQRLARSNKRSQRILGSALNLLAQSPTEKEQLQNTSASRFHERESDLQNALNKLSDTCYSANLQISVTGSEDNQRLAHSLIQQVFAPLSQFSAPRLAKFQLGKIENNPNSVPSFLLSCEEVASVVHPAIQRTESLDRFRFRQLEPPANIPTTNQAMTLGKTCFHNRNELFGLADKDAQLHGFVVGASGSGKTTLLQTAILDLVRRRQGVTLVDYHGDFAKSTNQLIPKNQRHQIIEFDATAERPLAFNPLSCPAGIPWPLQTDAVLTGIRMLFDSWGPRLEQILQNALAAAIIAKNANLFDVRRMLYDESVRANILSRVEDPLVREFWYSTFNSWPKNYRIEAIQSVVNKLDALLTPQLRSILCQDKPSFDFRQAFDNQKIIIVNLARGQLGQTAASTLGSFVLSAIQQAALSRANIAEDQRVPHSVFLDELQLYSNSQAITSLMAESRKYRVSIWSATQSLSGIDRDSVLPIVLSNAGNIVCFRVSHQDAVELVPLLDNRVSPEDLSSLPRFHAYARVMVDGEVQEPFSITTIKPNSKGRQNQIG